MRTFRHLPCLALALCCAAGLARAEAPAPDLTFREFFRLPVGPRGLEPSARLLALAGQRVRLSGYLVRQESAGLPLLAPQPVSLGDGDEGLADDLPINTVTVLGAIPQNLNPASPVRLTGVLALGPREESDGRISRICLKLELAEAADQP